MQGMRGASKKKKLTDFNGLIYFVHTGHVPCIAGCDLYGSLSLVLAKSNEVIFSVYPCGGYLVAMAYRFRC